jgi:hypothetical protein
MNRVLRYNTGEEFGCQAVEYEVRKMNHNDAPLQRSSRIKAYILWGTVVWTVIMVSSLIWNILHTKNQTLAKADVMARLAFEKDVAFRTWVTFHGGVYVPVTGETPSNPYLHVPEKDEKTSSGKNITLMNPAYVMRQYYERIDNKGGVTVVLDGHPLTITASIGISLYPDHGADIDTILKNADSAMYQAKQAGRNRYRLYNEA